MSRMQKVIDALEAERAEVKEHLDWLDGQIAEFRTRTGTDDGAAPAKRSVRRQTARRASSRRATARTRRRDLKEEIVGYVEAHPGSTAGEVAKGINANRNSVATRMSTMAKSGELTKSDRGYTVTG